MLNKNEHYNIMIEDVGSKGEGIGKINNFAVFVEGAVVGDLAEIKIVKVNKSFAYGKLTKIIESSPYRVEATCPVHMRCGGCTMQHIVYEKQLELKTKKVRDALIRIGGLKDVVVQNTIGMENPYCYRNKAQFPVRGVAGHAFVGLYSARSHDVVSIDSCNIQHPITTSIIKKIKQFMNDYKITPYNEKENTGLVRHILIKVGFSTNEVMVCMVINGSTLPYSNKLIESLNVIKGMTSIVLNENTKKTNVILGDKTHTLWGKDYISDKIGDIKFEISARSFFQVNPIQTKILYEKAIEFADVSSYDTVIDAYCGIGSVSLFFARQAKNVIGIEVVPDAVDDAHRNAILNEIGNAEFLLGKAEELLPQILIKGDITADVVVVDPPRKGLDSQLIEALLKAKPGKIVYISCDPATLARDLKDICAGGYTVGDVQPVDMFPMGMHVETVVSLRKC